MTLKAIKDDSAPMSRTEFEKFGNKAVRDAQRAGLAAVKASMLPGFVPGPSIGQRDLRQWRAQAKEAIEAWRKAETLVSEILHEWDRVYGE